jgi:glycerol-3-phosphate dehydrogenase subunit B
MSANEFDVLVIGEGLAGVVAAAAAVSRGAQVTLASTGPGRFVLATACLDLDRIVADGSGSVAYTPQELKEAVSFFADFSGRAGCAYEGSVEERRMLPTVMGTFQTVSLAPRSIWQGDPRSMAKAVIVGIEGLSGFDADFVAERLFFHTQQMGLNTSYRSVTIKPPEDLPRPLTTVEIATRWDRDPAYRAAFTDKFRSVVSDAELMILPGVLGVKSDDNDFKHLEEKIGCAICELPTMPPSVPGLRLLRHFERQLVRIGVEVITGFSVQKLCIDGDRCTGAYLDVPGRPRLIRADSVVLATGRFSHLLERQQSHDSSPRPPTQVDDELHALTIAGDVVPTNLFECGGALGKFDPLHGNAIAILTGHQAGILACETEVNYAAR